MNDSARDPFAPAGAGKPLPLAVRKQLVLARIVAERIEFGAALDDFRATVHPRKLLRGILRGSLGGTIAGVKGGSLALLPALLKLPRRYPILASIVGSSMSTLLRRRTRGGTQAVGQRRRGFHPLRWLVLGGAVYGAWRAFRADSAGADDED